MGMGMLQLLKISAIACSWLLLASSVHSLSPDSSAIPPISNGTASTIISPTPASLPNGTGFNPPAVLPPQTVPTPAAPVLPSAPDLAPESPVKNEPPLRKSPQNPPAVPPVVSGSVPPSPPESGTPEIPPPPPVTIAPAPKPPVRELPQNPPTMQPVVTAPIPTPIPPAEPVEPPLKKPPIPPITQPVVTGPPPPTPIPVPIAPVTAEPPSRGLPEAPPTKPPAVTRSSPPSPPLPLPVAPEPVEAPPRKPPQNPPTMQPVVVGSTPPAPHENGPADTPFPMPIAPAPKSSEQNRTRKNVSNHPAKPAVSPIPAVPMASPPSKSQGQTPPIHQKPSAEAPSSSPPKSDISPVSTPSSSVNRKRVSSPVAAPPSRMANHSSNMHTAPAKAPTTQRTTRRSSNVAALPHRSPDFPPEKGLHSPSSPPSPSPTTHHFVKKNITFAPLSHQAPPPASTTQGPVSAPVPSFHSKSDPNSTHRHHAHPPSSSGALVSPKLSPFASPKNHEPSPDSPSPTSPPEQSETPSPSHEISPTGSSARDPKKLFPPPFHALPPPPPNQDCLSLTCMDPLTNPPPKSPCVCVLPMQIGLSLGVALYTFFPLVSELAHEIAAGVFMNPSQVRIMGANAEGQYPEKTTVLIDLVPLGERFDNNTAFIIFNRFWNKEVAIKTSYFGDYEVLYVKYPGLPSPPSASSNGSSPGHGRAIQPLGVDVSGKKQRGGPNRSIVAVIVLSASVAVILCCAIGWVLLFKRRDRACQTEPTPPTTMPSLAKSPGNAVSVVGSGPNSPSLSFSSSFAAYTGSAKTFSSTDIERATDNFNESRVLGEGGFGRVYSGDLEDGTKVAVKIFKRDDHQGGREFLAEVEMLSRLHHRNLVKLIGICLEERARCLVYELIPNGSVESHLHGVDGETAPLDWNARVKIALGAARGLAYLHEDSSPRVIHRDFKSSNILLEHDFTPKVSDFGLARTAFDEENRHISTRVMGTFGYVAPEYAMTGHLLVKSDVYSYGVVLLELLTGRKPVDMSLPPGQENLVSWARPFLTSQEGLEFIVDRSLGPDFPFDSITKVAAIASMCVQPEVSNRPFMGEVVQALKLVCNECDETRELENQEDDSSTDTEARFSTTSGHTLDPLRTHSPHSNSDCELDLERGHSSSDLLSSSMRYGLSGSGPFGIYSRSGTLRTGRTRRLWQKMRQLPGGGSVSEHSAMFRLWSGSN